MHMFILFTSNIVQWPNGCVYRHALLQRANVCVWTPAVESVSKALCFCGRESYSNCANMKLGKFKLVWHISSSQNFSQSLRFLIHFQKLSTETVLYVELTLVPGETGISPFHKGNPRFCVCACVCGANSLEQTQSQLLGFATKNIQQIRLLAFLFSFLPFLPPCLPHHFHTLLKHVKSKQQKYSK